MMMPWHPPRATRSPRLSRLSLDTLFRSRDVDRLLWLS